MGMEMTFDITVLFSAHSRPMKVPGPSWAFLGHLWTRRPTPRITDLKANPTAILQYWQHKMVAVRMAVHFQASFKSVFMSHQRCVNWCLRPSYLCDILRLSFAGVSSSSDLASESSIDCTNSILCVLISLFSVKNVNVLNIETMYLLWDVKVGLVTCKGKHFIQKNVGFCCNT